MKKSIRFLKKYWKISAVLVIILLLTLVLLFQMAFVSRQYIYVRAKGSPGNWWWVTPRPPDWLANAVSVGDTEFNSMNIPIAEVVSVDVYDAGGSTRDIYVIARIEVKQNIQTKKYRFKGEPVEIGGPISMSLNSAFFPGMVVEIYGDKLPERTYTDMLLRIRLNGRWPYEYNAIIVGEKIQDGDGIVIAEILDKERRPSEASVTTDTGQVVRGFSPVYDDFFVTVKIKAEERNGEYIYREEQYLKMGNLIWLLFPSYNISGAQIMSIER